MLKTRLELQTIPWQVISKFAFLPDSPAPTPPPTYPPSHLVTFLLCAGMGVVCKEYNIMTV